MFPVQAEACLETSSDMRICPTVSPFCVYRSYQSVELECQVQGSLQRLGADLWSQVFKKYDFSVNA